MKNSQTNFLVQDIFHVISYEKFFSHVQEKYTIFDVKERDIWILNTVGSKNTLYHVFMCFTNEFYKKVEFICMQFVVFQINISVIHTKKMTLIPCTISISLAFIPIPKMATITIVAELQRNRMYQFLITEMKRCQYVVKVALNKCRSEQRNTLD